MALTRCVKFWLTLLLTFLYMLMVAIVALLNTALLTTERPYQKWYHEPGLYTIAKGFNVFFGITVLAAILLIAYEVGDRILRIANLRERSHYNFYLFLFSAIASVSIPFLYMFFVQHRIFTLTPYWNSFYLLTLSTCLALHACIFFVLAIFLFLTSLLTTLRSYNVFKFLVKLRLHKLPPPPLKSALRQKVKNVPANGKATVAFKQSQPLPTVIGRVPRRYRHRYQQQQQQQPYPQHLRPSTPQGRQQQVISPWIIQQQRRYHGRTPSIPSTSWQSHYSGTTIAPSMASSSSPRIIIIGPGGGHPAFHRQPRTPSLHSQASSHHQSPFNV